MENQFQQGDIVLLPFPYSDLSGKKLRPAVVISWRAFLGDYIVAQITSVPKNDEYTFPLTEQNTDIKLPKPSQVRTNKVFTVHESLITKQIATLTSSSIKALCNIIQTHIEPIA